MRTSVVNGRFEIVDFGLRIRKDVRCCCEFDQNLKSRICNLKLLARCHRPMVESPGRMP